MILWRHSQTIGYNPRVLGKNEDCLFWILFNSKRTGVFGAQWWTGENSKKYFTQGCFSLFNCFIDMIPTYMSLLKARMQRPKNEWPLSAPPPQQIGINFRKWWLISAFTKKIKKFWWKLKVTDFFKCSFLINPWCNVSCCKKNGIKECICGG